MRIYTNLRIRSGAYGGANAFMRGLARELRRRGVVLTTNPDDPVDLCLLNALSGGLRLEHVKALAARGRPIIHRKVGYAVSGSPEMRQVTDGMVHGDSLQIAFSPYIQHTIFQSGYSRDVFRAQGFAGPHTVIANGVDERLFNMRERYFLGLLERPRALWDGSEPFKLVISTWSKDLRKGFPEYLRIDGQLDGRAGLRVTLVGNVPDGYRFRNIRVVPPLPHRGLAALLKRQHAMLNLAEQETCSNSLLEGLNCGLPVIYLDSGSAKENANPYGVEYRGDIFEAVREVQERYREIVGRIPDNPFRMSLVGPRYLRVFEAIVGGHLERDEAPAA